MTESVHTFRAGDAVRFREGTPPHAANASRVFIVEPVLDALHHRSSDGVTLPDNAGGDGRRFVSIYWAEDAAKTPSRRRSRSAYVDALELVKEA